jgi:hypothetical protein
MDKIQPITTEEPRWRLSWDMVHAPLSKEQLMRIVEIVNE